MAVLPVLRSPMISRATAADRRHGVHGLDASLQRLIHRLAAGDAGAFDSTGHECGVTIALVVARVAERIDHAADHRLADRHARSCPVLRTSSPSAISR
jgi:hypothetical protein